MMMKKVVVLMMVLAMAAVSNAGLTYSWDKTEVQVGETFHLIISGLASDVPGYERIYDPFESGMASLNMADFTGVSIVNKNAGNLANAKYYGSYDGFDVEAYDIDNGNAEDDPADGVFFTLELTALAEGDFALTIFADDYVTPVGSIGGVTIVPEPISMVLLGIGGLFLRRRK
jgi:hypothetical protein